jgi:acyl-CoA thioester hydrolase
MTQPFTESFRARWPDMDFNQHMRNAAFLGCAEDTRMRFLDANGWPMAEFMKRKLGPVVVEDRLTYKKELQLLERFSVELWLAGTSSDGRKMAARNIVKRDSDGAECAIVDSFVLWFDLEKRRPVVPPAALLEVWLKLPRTEDFRDLT